MIIPDINAIATMTEHIMTPSILFDISLCFFSCIWLMVDVVKELVDLLVFDGESDTGRFVDVNDASELV